MTVEEDLIRAAEIMQERGRCRLLLIDDEGRCCPLGAIGIATIPEFSGVVDYGDGSDSPAYGQLGENPRAWAAINTLAKSIHGHLGDTDPMAWVYLFNDGMAQSDEEVVEAILTAAGNY